ncbi:hypothetical protein C9374_009248 [Naegleria lovaniensis]|uniref:Uncharacterized protein n=1 Tax=Naegleria lovaniensis TaxID=51637 RepID=A0AA88KEA2_NAELO|nr:uncharacterized protein C9374_009248 [Naegleria lovaniensis]KAG2377337.1 hypothetical protein C9374_009248 [Naegleria lovaniensis]
MLKSECKGFSSCLNFASQCYMLGYSSTLLPEGTGQVQAFGKQGKIYSRLRSLSSSSGSKVETKEEVLDMDSSSEYDLLGQVQQLVFASGSNDRNNCLIDSDELHDEMKEFNAKMNSRVNASEVYDLKEKLGAHSKSSRTDNDDTNTDDENDDSDSSSTTSTENLKEVFDFNDSTALTRLIPIRIPSRIGNRPFRVKKIACLESGTIILNEFDSKVFVIGEIADGMDRRTELTEISLKYLDHFGCKNQVEDERVVEIFTGADFAFFITEGLGSQKNLYSYGQNRQFQLSHPSISHSEVEEAIRVNPKYFNYENPSMISCGSQHAILVTDIGNIYFCGRLHNFQSTTFISCRISTITTGWMRDFLISKNIYLDSDYNNMIEKFENFSINPSSSSMHNSPIVVTKKNNYKIWQIIKSREIHTIFKNWIHRYYTLHFPKDEEKRKKQVRQESDSESDSEEPVTTPQEEASQNTAVNEPTSSSATQTENTNTGEANSETEKAQALLSPLDILSQIITEHYQNLQPECENNVKSSDILQLLNHAFKVDYYENVKTNPTVSGTSLETIFERDFQYEVLTEIITNSLFLEIMQKLLTDECIFERSIVEQFASMSTIGFANFIYEKRNNLVIYENTYCYTQKGFHYAKNLMNTFYESMILTSCDRLYHFPARGISPQMLTWNLLDPYIQIGPKQAETYRHRNGFDRVLRECYTPDSSMIDPYLSAVDDGFLTVFDMYCDIFYATSSEYLWYDKHEQTTDMKDNQEIISQLRSIHNPLPYDIEIELKKKDDGHDISFYFNTHKIRNRGNIATIQRVSEGIVMTTLDRKLYTFGSNAYSELGEVSVVVNSAHFNLNEHMTALEPVNVFCDQYAMVVEGKRAWSHQLDPKWFGNIPQTILLRQLLTPFQYGSEEESKVFPNTFYFSGDSSGARSINDYDDDGRNNDQDNDDVDPKDKTITELLHKDSEKIVEFPHLSLLRYRYMPYLHKLKMHIVFGLDFFIVYFTLDNGNTAKRIMANKLSQLVNSDKLADCTIFLTNTN